MDENLEYTMENLTPVSSSVDHQNHFWVNSSQSHQNLPRVSSSVDQQNHLWVNSYQSPENLPTVSSSMDHRNHVWENSSQSPQFFLQSSAPMQSIPTDFTFPAFQNPVHEQPSPNLVSTLNCWPQT